MSPDLVHRLHNPSELEQGLFQLSAEDFMSEEGRRKLDEASKGLEQEAPDRVARAIRWLRNPKAKWVRIPLGLLLIVGGFFGFLPVLGVEFIPLGLLLIAQDVPPLQKPVANATLWLEHKWVQLRIWWQNRKHRHTSRAR